ncbi:MAG TPA: hypothetical protein VFL12_10080 [Thermoanaerobaculia bacterium]|nr:hypothetical protein [Thermoanaerobaculia bacterium]
MAGVLPAVVLCLAAPLAAGFASMETYLPAVGRIPGAFGAQFYTTIWATNLTGATVHFTFEFLKQGQANTSPASFADTLTPGETKTYENVVETKLSLNNALGAARVVSDGEILVSERIYNQEPGDDLGKTEGLFFAGVPKGFSIALGQSASIQGINQGGAENFRYNFALVETGGASTTVHVVLYDGDGHSLGSKDYILQAYEQIQPNVDDLAANLATTNARITATVTAGTGSVLLAGAQLANESQDSSGFEMSFRDDLLGGGGGGGGLSVVSHDGTLVGNGTGGSPLGINPAAVVTSVNGLHGAVTLSAGSNVTITPSGQTLTIAASGGGGGGALTLPYSGTATAVGHIVFSIANEDASSSDSVGVYGTSKGGPGVEGNTGAGPAILGTTSGAGGTIGVEGLVGGSATAGVYGQNNGGGGGDGVYGIANTGSGVKGHGNGHGAGVYGENSGDGSGGYFYGGNGQGVVGQSASNHGVEGDAGQPDKAGVYGTNSSSGPGVFAESVSNVAIIAKMHNGLDDAFWAEDGSGTIRFIITAEGDAIAHGYFTPTGIDYADRLPAGEGPAPGDVLAIGEDGLLRRSSHPNAKDVAGVYSTKPGVIGRQEDETRTTIPLALAGVVPVHVTNENGPIRTGDLLVSSSSPGRAMRAPDAPAPGTVIGKAMQRLDSATGTITLLVWQR